MQSTSKRLQYSEVYSSSSDDEVTGQKFKIADGRFVVVQFMAKKKKKHYIGKIISAVDKGGLSTLIKKKFRQ